MNIYYSVKPVTYTVDDEVLEVNKYTCFFSIGLIADNGESFYAEDSLDYWSQEDAPYTLPINPNGTAHVEKFRHDWNGEGAYSVEVNGKRNDIAEQLLDWFEQFKDQKYVQLVSDCEPHAFSNLLNMVNWNLPDYINPVPFEVTQMLEVCINRNRFNGKANLSELMRASIDFDREEAYNAIREFDEINIDKGSLKDADRVRTLYSAFKGIYHAPSAVVRQEKYNTKNRKD